MRLAVGYQLPDGEGESIAEIVASYANSVEEIYFPWPYEPSGRAPLASHRGYLDWTALERLEADLRFFRSIGLKLDLLLNANCYGRWATSEWLANRVISILDWLGERVGGVDVVTTASLTIAHVIKTNFPEVRVRASVNMRIGTVQAMEYVSDLFDSFHVQRDHNRDLSHLQQLKEWADENGKELCILANSGCLRFCPGQVFHDNMVAHEDEINETLNISDWVPLVCWRLMSRSENWVAILQSTWIRPEDLHNYDGLVSLAKLATRMHSRPRAVIHAYATGQYAGNLLDLLEPGFGPALAPYIIDNSRFPDDWFERTSTCRGECHKCDYCSQVLKQVLVDSRTVAG